MIFISYAVLTFWKYEYPYKCVSKKGDGTIWFSNQNYIEIYHNKNLSNSIARFGDFPIATLWKNILLVCFWRMWKICCGCTFLCTIVFLSEKEFRQVRSDFFLLNKWSNMYWKMLNWALAFSRNDLIYNSSKIYSICKFISCLLFILF